MNRRSELRWETGDQRFSCSVLCLYVTLRKWASLPSSFSLFSQLHIKPFTTIWRPLTPWSGPFTPVSPPGRGVRGGGWSAPALDTIRKELVVVLSVTAEADTAVKRQLCTNFYNYILQTRRSKSKKSFLTWSSAVYFHASATNNTRRGALCCRVVHPAVRPLSVSTYFAWRDISITWWRNFNETRPKCSSREWELLRRLIMS